MGWFWIGFGGFVFLELLFYGMVDWLVRLCFSGGKLRVLGLLIAMMNWCFGCIVVVCLFCCGVAVYAA